ncbi:metal-sensing transcriptional repressor [Candidatus Gottesmanbacteria bacterium]|nr:metal-sensing transcriptional repressor [Candidatus Gottesmanbacteria bacterium]
MYKPKTEKERILHRLKITMGHLKKVYDMVYHHDYCIDVLHQSQAVQKALAETDHLILETHLNSCVVSAIKKGQSQRVIKEIMEVMEKKRRT